MDIYCQRCAEPYETYYVYNDMNHEAENGKNRFLKGEGCPCCNWGKKAPKNKPQKAVAMSVLSDMLGDDVDGMASMMDDFEYMGGFDE